MALLLGSGVTACTTAQTAVPLAPVVTDPALFVIPADSQVLAGQACGVSSLRIEGGAPELLPGSGLTMAEYVSRLFLTTCEAGILPRSQSPLLIEIKVAGDTPVSLSVDDGGGPLVFVNPETDPEYLRSISGSHHPQRASFLVKSVLAWFDQRAPGVPHTAKGLFELFCDGSPMMIPEMPDPAPGPGPVFMLVAADNIRGSAFDRYSRIEWAYAAPVWASDGVGWSNTRGGSTGLVRPNGTGGYAVQPIFLVQDASSAPGECQNSYDLSGSGLSEADQAGLRTRLAVSDADIAASNPDPRTSICSRYTTMPHPTRFEGSISGGLGGLGDHASFSLLMQVRSGATPDEQIQMTTSMLWGRRDVSWNTCNRAVRRPPRG